MIKFLKKIGNPSIWLRDNLFRGDADYMLHTLAGGHLGVIATFITFMLLPPFEAIILSLAAGFIVGMLWELAQGLLSSSKYDWWDVLYTWFGWVYGTGSMLIINYI